MQSGRTQGGTGGRSMQKVCVQWGTKHSTMLLPGWQQPMLSPQPGGQRSCVQPGMHAVPAQASAGAAKARKVAARERARRIVVERMGVSPRQDAVGGASTFGGGKGAPARTGSLQGGISFGGGLAVEDAHQQRERLVLGDAHAQEVGAARVVLEAFDERAGADDLAA